LEERVRERRSSLAARASDLAAMRKQIYAIWLGDNDWEASSPQPSPPKEEREFARVRRKTSGAELRIENC